MTSPDISKNAAMSKGVKWLLVIAVVVSAWYFWWQFDKHKQCEDMALQASVEEVTPDQYPSAAARQRAQEDYQARYMTTCSALKN